MSDLSSHCVCSAECDDRGKGCSRLPGAASKDGSVTREDLLRDIHAPLAGTLKDNRRAMLVKAETTSVS